MKKGYPRKIHKPNYCTTDTIMGFDANDLKTTKNTVNIRFETEIKLGDKLYKNGDYIGKCTGFGFDGKNYVVIIDNKYIEKLDFDKTLKLI